MSTETKRERFVRLAEKRTNQVIEKLRVLGGCANRRMYEYNSTDIDKIKTAINNELELLEVKFSNEPEAFSLE